MQHDTPKRRDPTELEPRPQPGAPPDGRSNVAQLRRDIESGATGDKVPVLDPASTPLGTDDEAAGAPPSPELVDAVRRQERETRASNAAIGTANAAGADRNRTRLFGGLALAVGLGLAALWISFG
jgi:hypothetical protein